MVIIGFALMAAFLKRYTHSGICYNLLIAAIAIQWGIFFHEIVLTRARGVLLSIQRYASVFVSQILPYEKYTFNATQNHPKCHVFKPSVPSA